MLVFVSLNLKTGLENLHRVKLPQTPGGPVKLLSKPAENTVDALRVNVLMRMKTACVLSHFNGLIELKNAPLKNQC